ncbi:MAG: homoserine kinase [Polyangiaceae bacterium]|nr:homoserine kinase [Polyangiaceae bacterium]
MALLTPLAHDKARQLLLEWGLQLHELRALEAGSVNSNFLFSTEDGQGYFARIYEEQGPSGAFFELELNERLNHVGVPVALPVRKLDGGLLDAVEGKPFAIYQQVRGESICQKMVTPREAHAVGEALARVHQADLQGLEIPAGRFDQAGIEERLALIWASERSELRAAVEEVRELLKEVADWRAAQANSLPQGLIHGDLFKDNILLESPLPADRSPQVTALLDFESACFGPYVYDLMVTLLAWCFGESLSPELGGAMIAGYHQVRPLSELEVAAMVPEGCFAAARFATTRMTDFSLRVAPGHAPGRDYRRFFQRAEALKSGALASAVKIALGSSAAVL